MRSIGSFLLVIVLFVCCTETKKDTKATLNSKKIIPDPVILESDKISALDTLTFDWFELKQSIQFLNCGARIASEKNKFNPVVPPAFLYDYCAHNGSQPMEQRIVGKELDSKLIETIVLKKDGKIGQYGDRNEELLFIHVSAKLDQLGVLNVVQKTKNEIIVNFGIPDADTLNTLVYISRPKVLILHYNDKLAIEQFKYYLHFNPDVNSLDNLQDLRW